MGPVHLAVAAMKYLVVILLAALCLAGGVAGCYRNRASSLEAEKEQARLNEITTKRNAEEADRKNAEEILRWKGEATKAKAETARVKSMASAAERNVKAVVKAGERLEKEGTTGEILAALTARGYHPVRCRP